MMWRRVHAAVLAFALAIATLHGTTASAAASSELKQVLVLSRHGVRGPYGLGEDIPTLTTLRQYARNPNLSLPLDAVSWGTSETDDPTEHVSPKLTKHGYAVVQRMGNYFREHLYANFVDATCGKTFSYADANQRDNLTAQAFVRGLHPSCKDVVPITAATRLLFEQGQDPTANCPVCSKTIYEGITGANDSRYLLDEIRREVTEINDILQCCAPTVCAAAAAGRRLEQQSNDTTTDDDSDVSDDVTCSLFGVPSVWSGAFYEPWRDTMSIANYFSEFWLLQALNNMALPAGLSFDTILRLSRVHKAHMDLITNEVNAASFGATLVAHLTASMEQRVLGKPLPNIGEGDGPHLVQKPDNEFLFYAAHDINLLYVRRLLRLEWHTKGWHPHQPVPGSMLVFELHTSADDDVVSIQNPNKRRRLSVREAKHFVKLFFLAASPEQLRSGDALSSDNPPDRVPVIIPSCSEDVELPNGATDVRCSFETFKQLIGKTLKHECVADTLRPFVDSLLQQAARVESIDGARGNKSGGSSQYDDLLSAASLMWLVFAVLVATFLVLAIRHAVLQRRQRSAAAQKREYGTLPQVTTVE